MYKIKQSLDALNYGAYFYDGPALSMREIVERAARFGYEGVDIWPHRPLFFPLDVSKKERKDLLEFARSKNVQFAAVDAATNFMRSDHVLVPRLEKELLYVQSLCELARDLECPIVRILPAFIGYFWPIYWNQGYGNIAIHSRSMETSILADYQLEWEAIRSGIKDCGRIAADYGITLAIQGHPPVTNDTKDLLDIVDEVGMENVKIGLDLSLMDSQEEEFIRTTVIKVGKRMVHSHSLGIIQKRGPHGFIYATEEVIPGDGHENWPAFLKACKEIGYSGFFAYEQCAPFLMKGHVRPTLEEFDRRQQVGYKFLKGVADSI